MASSGTEVTVGFVCVGGASRDMALAVKRPCYDDLQIKAVIKPLPFTKRIINLRHRRWTEVTVFTPVCLFVCLFVNSITEKTPRQISTKLGGGD